jgi:flagellar basal body-associated protein FliL
MRALKILVIVLGVLLVAGTAALVWAVANRINHPPAPSAPAAASASEVELPPGARIVSTEASGDRLIVRLSLSDGSEELLIFNLGNGARVATIRLRAKSPAP